MTTVPFAEGGVTRIRRETKILLEPEEASRLAGRLAAEIAPYECRVACVYFDSPDGKLARRAATTPDDCVKIRTRSYDPDLGDRPGRVALDVKRERGGITSKDRLWLPPEDVPAEVRRALAPTFGAIAPTVASTYRRRVFQASPEWRATFDDELRFHAAGWSLFAPGTRPSLASLAPPFAGERLVVLELKHAPGALPAWLVELGRARGIAYSKFAAGSRDAGRVGSSGA
ncbi:MAG TPA: VTC domain-containing protein [Anaeromyxobacter sp.]|nr:VTC domain-containing protein [Anaeromyxobacter sp.]